MRLLFDANLSPEVVRRLKAAGHDAIHVDEIGLLTAPDPKIMQAAVEADRRRRSWPPTCPPSPRTWSGARSSA